MRRDYGNMLDTCRYIGEYMALCAAYFAKEKLDRGSKATGASGLATGGYNLGARLRATARLFDADRLNASGSAPSPVCLNDLSPQHRACVGSSRALNAHSHLVRAVRPSRCDYSL